MRAFIVQLVNLQHSACFRHLKKHILNTAQQKIVRQNDTKAFTLYI